MDGDRLKKAAISGVVALLTCLLIANAVYGLLDPVIAFVASDYHSTLRYNGPLVQPASGEGELRPGDLLLAVDGRSVRSSADLEAVVQDTTDPVTLRIFHLTDTDAIDVVVPRQAVQPLAFGVLPSSLYVKRIPEESGPLQPGDLVIRVAGVAVAELPLPDASRLARWQRWLGSTRYDLEAPAWRNIVRLEAAIDAAGLGALVTYDLLRGGEPVAVTQHTASCGLQDVANAGANAAVPFVLWVLLAPAGVATTRRFGSVVGVPVAVATTALGIEAVRRLFIGQFVFALSAPPVAIVAGDGVLLFAVVLVPWVHDDGGLVWGREQRRLRFVHAGLRALIGLVAVFGLLPRLLLERPTGRAILAATLGTVVLLGWHWSAAAAVEHPDYLAWDRVRIMTFQRGPIPVGILWAFCLGCWGLIDPPVVTLLRMTSLVDGNREAIEAFERHGVPGLLDAVNRHGDAAPYPSAVRRLAAAYGADPDQGQLTAVQAGIVEEIEQAASDGFAVLVWSQGALPLLGFIGTVAGLGQAMAVLGGGMMAAAAGNQRIDPKVLQSGFSDVALAFETTFMGLMGLLIVSTGDTIVKAIFARSLANMEHFLQRVVAQWVPGSVVAELATAREARSAVEHLAFEVFTKGKHPALEAVRDVILAPLVQFEEDRGGLAEALTAIVGRSGRGTTVLAIDFATSGRLGDIASAALILAKAGGDLHVVHTDGAGKPLWEKTIGSAEAGAVGVGDHTSVFAGSGNRHAVVLRGRSEFDFDDEAADATEWTWPVADATHARCAGGRFAIVLCSDGVAADLWSIALGASGSSQRVGALEEGPRWQRIVSSPGGERVFVLGADPAAADRGCRLMAAKLVRNPETPDALSLGTRWGVPLSLTDPIDSVAAVADDQLVFTAGERVFVYDSRVGEHQRCAAREWVPGRIVAESRRRIAVMHTDRRLRIWRLRGSDLIPYPGAEWLATHPMNLFAAVDGGNRLFGVTGGRIVSWRFPESTFDRFVPGT